MSNVDIYVANATPHSFHLGTNDKSGRVQTPVAIPRPMFMPFFLFYGQKGTTKEVVVDGASFNRIFGDETLNENSPYFNHTSAFIKGVLGNAGTILAKRIIPEGADKVASLRLSLEYLETTVEEYQRDASGNFVKNAQGAFVSTGKQVPGVLYKFVVTEVPTTSTTVGSNTYNVFEFGKGSESVGSLSNNAGGTSKRIPIMDFAVSSPGAHGNLSGIRLWSPYSNDQTPINLIALNDTGSYPLRLTLMTKTTPTANAVISTSLKGAREIDFTLKPNSKSKAGVRYHLSETFVPEYNDLNPSDPTMPPSYGPFSRLHVYQANIDRVLELFIKKEIDTEVKGDFVGTTDINVAEKKYLFNLFGGRHSDGTPYQTFRLGDFGTDGVLLDKNVTLWATGGSDGVMNDTLFAHSVDAWLEEVADPNSNYVDDVDYSDSCFWDTGFPLETKLKIGKYISSRKDRWAVISTHINGEEQVIPVAEENARLAAIRGAARLYPDSTIYGTPTYRVIAVKGSGRLLKEVSSHHTRLPITYELACLLTKYWGARLGRANTRWDYTEGDNNQFMYMTDVSNTWTPYIVRNQAWAAGGMWSQRNERKRDFFPMYRTIYDDDSSTLMNIRTMLVHCELNKIGYEGHRRFSGKDWPEDRFLQELTEWYLNQVKDFKFGAKVEVEFKHTLTEIDKQRGWSWHTEAIVYSDGQRTVQVFNTTNMRRTDKPENSNAIIA